MESNGDPARVAVDARAKPFYRPDDGFSMLFIGALSFVFGICWALSRRDHGGTFWWEIAWIAVIFLSCTLVGLYRRHVYHATGGRWPDLPPGVVEPPEPVRFLSGKTRERSRAIALSREPALPLAVGGPMAVLGVILPIASAGWNNGTFVPATCVGVAFILVGGFFVVTSLIRLRWMAKYKRIVGHSPW